MTDDERDPDDHASRGDQQTGEDQSSDGPSAESGDTDYLADADGNVEMLESEGGMGFGDLFAGGPFRRRERFDLKTPSFWSRPLRILLLVLGVFYVGSVLPDVFTQGLTPLSLIGLIGIPSIILLAIAYRAWKLPEEGLQIRLYDDRIEMPKGADNPTMVEVDPRDLRSIVVMARGESELLLLETEKNRFVFADENFREANGPRLLKEEIMQRVRAHPESQEIIERMNSLERRAREASSNPTPVMYGLLAMVVAGYVIEHMTGAIDTPLGLVQLGANSTPLIADGQWWRLISGNFLHGNFLHIFLNGMALFFLGLYIERLVGSWRFLFIYLVSALGGSLGSFYWTEAPLSVGASTALYGLFGAFGVLHIKYWRQLPPPYRQTIQWWVVILGINGGISLLPFVDAAAHFVGIGVGALVTFPVLVGLPNLEPTKDAHLWVKIATAAMTVVFAAGLGIASNYAQHDHPGDRTRIVQYEIEKAREKKSPTALNQAAWQYAAINPDATRRQLMLAREASREAVDIAETREGLEWKHGTLAARDTLATIEYRLGLKSNEKEKRRERFATAVEMEWETLRRDEELEDISNSWLPWKLGAGDPTSYQTQVGRFLEAYLNEFDTFQLGPKAGQDVQVELSSRNESLALELDIDTRAERSMTLLALAFSDKKRTGMFRICVPAGAKGGIIKRFGPDQWSTGLGPDSHVRLGMIDTENADCSGSEVSVDYWPTDMSVQALP